MSDDLLFLAKPYIIASVIGLLFIRRPSAILGAVWTVVVNAIKRFAQWPVSHVRPEIHKRINPSFANFYSPAAISRVIFTVRIAASVFHAVPRLVSFSVRPAMFKSVFLSGVQFSPNAAATCRGSSAHSICQYSFGTTTGTRTNTPHFSLPRKFRENRESSVNVSNNAKFSWHSKILRGKLQ